jgi:hypothetical protein
MLRALSTPSLFKGSNSINQILESGQRFVGTPFTLAWRDLESGVGSDFGESLNRRIKASW